MSETRLDLITKNLADTIDLEKLKEILKTRTPHEEITAYWGTEPTCNPSLGYLIPLIKIRDLTKAHIHVKIFLADIHASLNKNPYEQDKSESRSLYYQFLISAVLSELDADKKYISFVRGTTIQLDPLYVIKLYELMCKVPISDALHAGKTVVIDSGNPVVGHVIYPIMQALDESLLNTDIQLGGVDQVGIFNMARKYVLDNSNTYLVNHLLPDLVDVSNKMSSDSPDESYGKICFTDTVDQITRKIGHAGAVCIKIIEYILYPMGYLYADRSKISYTNYNALMHAYSSKKITLYELQKYIIEALTNIIEPIRNQIIKADGLYERAFDKAQLQSELVIDVDEFLNKSVAVSPTSESSISEPPISEEPNPMETSIIKD